MDYKVFVCDRCKAEFPKSVRFGYVSGGEDAALALGTYKRSGELCSSCMFSFRRWYDTPELPAATLEQCERQISKPT